MKIKRLLNPKTRKGALVLGVVGLGLVVVGAGAYAAIYGGPLRPAASSDINLQKGLIGWWKLDGNGKDSSSYRRIVSGNGTAVTADREGKSNGALSFNGTTDYLHTGSFDSSVMSSSSFSSSWTISIWAKAGSGENFSRDNVLIGKPGCNGGIVTDSGGAPGYAFNIWNSGCTGTYTVDWPGVSTASTAWHLITATYSNGTMAMYGDGQLIGTKVATDMYNYGNDLFIGASGYNGTSATFPFTGSLDDARVYNRALSAAEAKALYDQYDPGIQTDSGEKGLVGWWKFDGNANDATPNRDNGTVNGATLTTDRKGSANSAYAFNGSTASVSATDSGALNVTGDATISAWVNPTTLTGFSNGEENVVQKRTGLEDEPYSLMVDNGGAIYSSWKVTSGGDVNGYFGITSTTAIATGSFYHIAVTRNSTQACIYINGVQDTCKSMAGVGSPVGNALPLNIGGETSQFSGFSGSIDDVRVYGRALSASEIINQYKSYDSQINIGANPTNSTSSGNISQGLVAYWNFNGNANDSTPYRNNGVVTSATLTTDRKGRANSAYAFDGTTSYINVSPWNLISGSAPRTVSMWFKTTTASAGAGINFMLIDWGGSSSLSGSYIRFYNGMLGFDVTSCAAQVSETPYIDGNWHHVVGTTTGSSSSLYIDGSLQATNACGPINTSITADLTIGAGDSAVSGTHGGKFTGSLDEVRIYDRVLSAGEVTELYNSSN